MESQQSSRQIALIKPCEPNPPPRSRAPAATPSGARSSRHVGDDYRGRRNRGFAAPAPAWPLGRALAPSPICRLRALLPEGPWDAVLVDFPLAADLGDALSCMARLIALWPIRSGERHELGLKERGFTGYWSSRCAPHCSPRSLPPMNRSRSRPAEVTATTVRRKHPPWTSRSW